MKVTLFTARATAMAVALAALVTATLPSVAGEGWALAFPAGLAAGVLALVTALQLRDGRFFTAARLEPGLANGTVFLLAYVAATALGLDRDTGWTLAGVIVLAGAAAYSLGFVAGATRHIEDDPADDARLRRVTQPPDAGRTTS